MGKAAKQRKKQEMEQQKARENEFQTAFAGTRKVLIGFLAVMVVFVVIIFAGALLHGGM